MTNDIRKVKRGKKIADIFIVITILLTIGQLIFDVFTRSNSNIEVIKNIIVLIVIGCITRVIDLHLD